MSRSKTSVPSQLPARVSPRQPAKDLAAVHTASGGHGRQLLGFLPQVILLSDGRVGEWGTHKAMGRWRDQDGEKEKYGDQEEIERERESSRDTYKGKKRERDSKAERDIENERETQRDRKRDGQRERRLGRWRGR